MSLRGGSLGGYDGSMTMQGFKDPAGYIRWTCDLHHLLPAGIAACHAPAGSTRRRCTLNQQWTTDSVQTQRDVETTLPSQGPHVLQPTVSTCLCCEVCPYTNWYWSPTSNITKQHVQTSSGGALASTSPYWKSCWLSNGGNFHMLDVLHAFLSSGEQNVFVCWCRWYRSCQQFSFWWLN